MIPREVFIALKTIAVVLGCLGVITSLVTGNSTATLWAATAAVNAMAWR